MITIKQIKNKFCKAPICHTKKIKRWINIPICQAYIKKALQYKLTNSDYKELYRIGNYKSIYPALNYLCAIYIHPCTIGIDL
jgi:hypothetical protein